MRKSRWRSYLNGECKLGKNAECKMLFDIRRRAICCMESLTFILDSLLNMGKVSARQCALIFDNDQRYFKMLKTLSEAYKESCQSELKLFAPENLDIIQMACLRAGFKKLPSLKQIADRHSRAMIIEKLRKKEVQSGYSYFEDLGFRSLSRSLAHANSETKSTIESDNYAMPDLIDRRRKNGIVWNQWCRFVREYFGSYAEIESVLADAMREFMEKRGDKSPA